MKIYTLTDRFDSTGKPADLELVKTVLSSFGYEITGERNGHLYAAIDGNADNEEIAAEITAARTNAGHVSDATRKERSERMKARHAYRRDLLALHEETAILMNPVSGSVQSWEDWKTDQKAEKWPIEELRSLVEVK